MGTSGLRKDVSIVVCTYDRRHLLNSLLGSLVELEDVPDAVWDIVLVDNNSSDGTRELVHEYAGKLPIRYVYEPQQGKCHALNRAVETAKSALLLFVDDDVVVEPSWLATFWEESQAHPECGWFGGRVKPDWGDGWPRWYSSETAAAFSGYFGDYDLGPVSRIYEKEDKLPLGACLAIRRAVFDDVGGFRLDLGPRGKLRGVGDETDLLQRAARAGFRGWYTGTATVFHHVGNARLRLSSFVTYGIGKGLNQYRMGIEDGHRGTPLMACWHLLRGGVQGLKGRGDRMRLSLIRCGIEMGRYQAARDNLCR